MEKFAKAADPNSSFSIAERIGILFEASQTVAALGRSWCPVEDLTVTEVNIGADITKGSEEHQQLIRVALRVDDICSLICGKHEDLGADVSTEHCLNLYWSLAVCGRYSEKVIHRIQMGINRKIGSNLDLVGTCKLLFAEASFFHKNSTIDVSFDEETFAGFALSIQANILQSSALIGKDAELLNRLKKVLLSTTLKTAKYGDESEKASLSSLIPFIARIVAYIGALGGSDSHHELGKLKAISPLASRLPAWKYSFELCLACHAVATKGVELNPLVALVFPTDILYTPPKGRKKLVVELVRPCSIVWSHDDTDLNAFGVDVYTRMARLTLSRLGYRVIAITLTEWLRQKGDKGRQMAYVKRRIRNCLQKRRLFSGMERDMIRSDTESGEEVDGSSDSDMSY
jgi:hypothetical protein